MEAVSIFQKIKSHLNHQAQDNAISTDLIILSKTKKKGDYTVKVDKTVLCKIICQNNQNYIRISKQYAKFLKDFPGNYTIAKDDNYLLPVTQTESLDHILRVLSNIFDDITLPDVAHFGCCSRYVACSDAKQCVHPDKNTAKACGYKKNLDLGKIFYGKNKNI